MNLPSTPMSAASGWRPADPPRRPVLFVNPRSGGGKAARADLSGRARERGVEAVILDPGQDLAALARGAAAGGADALGVAGGDGSLAVVAAVAAAHGIAFACVPAGTRNYFALDAGVDRHDLTAARAILNLIAPGATRMAEAPGHAAWKVGGARLDRPMPTGRGDEHSVARTCRTHSGSLS